MSTQAIANVLSTRLKDLNIPTYFENQKQFSPPANAVYLIEALLPAQNSAVSLAYSGSTQHRGVYQVSVMAPRDQYKAVGLSTAETVRAQFARGTLLAGDGVKVRIIQASNNSSRMNGDRWMIPITITYEAFTT